MERTLVTGADWNNTSAEKLWLYNLHYFDYLNVHEAEKFRRCHLTLIDRWIAENPLGRGTGWEPYPTSLRIVNWIKWFLIQKEYPPGAIRSLVVQIRWLRRRLEYHLLGNHLLANAKALLFGGLFFQGNEADEWIKKGLSLLEREISEQVLQDGGHFERSPMYHLIALDDMLDIINVCSTFGWLCAKEWVSPVTAMLNWASQMHHPDGELAFFNDAAIGIAATPEQIFKYAQRLGIIHEPTLPSSTAALLQSGYVKFRTPECTVFFDVGAVGPDYIPGHAHADTLSVEVSAGNHRLFVNSGTSLYGTSLERLRQRGTGAHNTIQVDHEDSSEVWSGFRVGRRAYVHDVSVEIDRLTASAWHDGYTCLSGRPKHMRKVTLSDSALKISDCVSGSGNHSVVGRFYLHPDVSIRGVHREGGTICLILDLDKSTMSRRFNIEGSVDVVVEDSTYHPEFGKTVSNKCIVFTHVGPLPCIVNSELTW
jgi:uncharacterized heparinase superfamily protein